MKLRASDVSRVTLRTSDVSRVTLRTSDVSRVKLRTSDVSRLSSKEKIAAEVQTMFRMKRSQRRCDKDPRETEQNTNITSESRRSTANKGFESEDNSIFETASSLQSKKCRWRLCRTVVVLTL